MEKNAIKKFAVWARVELIERVTQKAHAYGIEAKNIVDENADSIDGVLLTATEKKQRKDLIAKIKIEGFEQVMEEVAYTWFNRFTALRFMEVNNYLPSHTRVFTNESNEFKPQILADAISLELDGLDLEKVYELKNANKDEELYRYLLFVQCNALSNILPGMFQKMADYTELLCPNYLLRDGSVIEQMIKLIPEQDWTEQVQIIGWLYQYYNDECRNSVINMYKGVIKKADIPAATQLFTTDWIVRYLVDNSLGRYWIEKYPDSKLEENLPYLVKNNIDYSRTHINVTPETLTFFDPCMGSGHFLVYAFDIFMCIYKEFGYSDREAANLIVTNNLYGLDIDKRASQLAYFSIMMKARQYDRRFFYKGIQPKVFEIRESSSIDKQTIDYISDFDTKTGEYLHQLMESMSNSKEYGSLIAISEIDFGHMYSTIEEILKSSNIFTYDIENHVIPFLHAAEVISRKYNVVATNPPYLNRMNDSLKKYVTSRYKDYWSDLFSVFMIRNLEYCTEDGYAGFMTPFVWMFIRAYEKLRTFVLTKKSIVTLIQMEYSAYEEATVPICSFVLKNDQNCPNGSYYKLSEFKGGMEIQKKKYLEALSEGDFCNYHYNKCISDLLRISGHPIAFWASERIINIFERSKPFSDYATIRVGMHTGDNNIFLREWYEVAFSNICFNCKSHEESKHLNTKWYPYNKGGGTRKWYGYRTKVVNWKHGGEDIHRFHNLPMTYNGAPVRAKSLQFLESITWSDVGSTGNFGCRYTEPGAMFDVKGSSAFVNDKSHLKYAMAFLNSDMVSYLLQMLNPTISYQVGNISALPFKVPNNDILALIDQNVNKCIENERWDWNSREISWEFKRNPLIMMGEPNLELAFKALQNTRTRIKASEIELENANNQLIMELYGVEDMQTNYVKNIFIRESDLREDIVEFISYAVGCMFGRYSLDKPGLIYAGDNWDVSKYNTFKVDKDNIIPVCDDEYFNDDIVGYFVRFVETVYGNQVLEDNLRFIANALGGTGQPRDVIRGYFINNFYSDHLKCYQKRPIYWLFDSGKKNGFKCLIYMHRYQPDTIARIRTDYVHEQQSRYRTAIEELNNRITSVSTSERVKLNKKFKTLQEQAEELRVYEEKIHHLADQMISIDLDDGVKTNYAKFQDVLAKIK